MKSWWFIRWAWRELPGPLPDRYPAHIHLILDKDYRGFRIGRRLVDASAEHFRKKGIRGGHAVVIEEVGKNAFARVFGARVIEARKATLWEHCTNRQWEFKLMAKDL